MTRARVVAAVVLVALGLFFGGISGLVAGLAIAAGTLTGVLPRRALWPAAVACLAAAPLALLAQGLPTGPVIGPGFGAKHLIAHVLVGLALALAGYAGLLELLEGDDEARRTGPPLTRTQPGPSPPG